MIAASGILALHPGSQTGHPFFRSQTICSSDVFAAFFQFVEQNCLDRVTAEYHHVLPFFDCCPDDGFEAALHCTDTFLSVGSIAEYIDGHHAVGGQRIGTAFVKLRGVENRRSGIFIVQVDLEYVDCFAAFYGFDIQRGIGFQYGQTIVVRRQMEGAATDIDYVRIEFDCRYFRIREIVVTKFGQCGAAESELYDMFSARRKCCRP